jgi:hypothetical protein
MPSCQCGQREQQQSNANENLEFKRHNHQSHYPVARRITDNRLHRKPAPFFLWCAWIGP